MIITCSQCQAKFKVAPEQIKETGSKVRCSNCQYVFTVFRPRKPGEDKVMDLPVAAASSGALDSYLDSLKSGGRDQRADDYGLDDMFGDRPAPRPDGRDLAEDYEDPDDGLDDFPEPEDDGPHLRAPDKPSVSMRERRDRRRQLYSDLEDESASDDLLGDGGDFDEDGLVDEAGRPPLRRTARGHYEEPAAESEGHFDEPYEEPYDEQYDEQYDDQGQEGADEYDEDEPAAGEYSYESTRLARQVSDLGLSADPVDPDKFIDDTAGEGRFYSSQESPTIRAAVTKSPGRSPLLLIIGLVALALVLGLGIYFLTSRPADKVLSDGEDAGRPELGEVERSGGGGGDQNGTEGITFTRGNQNHYFRENNEAGNILIITGMVRNSYPDRRNFIRLRGHLLSADGRTLSDRFVYAGNIISEDELKTLSMREIVARLSIKGGQDGRNMNIEPGQEIPFMLVFDKLPDGMAEYRIDPVGSSPSD